MALEVESRDYVETDEGSSVEELVVNIGPSHPSTHGVGRFIVRLDGDVVVDAEPVIGYLHRGIEKMAENRTYLQVVPLTDRLDYVGSMYANWAYCRAVERLAGIRVPERAEYIRVIVCELQRIASHMMGLGASAADTGAFTFFVYAFDQRERVVELFERLCGARLTYNYVRPGGVARDVPEDWLDDAVVFTGALRDALAEMDKLFFGNTITRGRLKGVGVLSAEDAVAWGASGPVARASGVNWDLRKHDPYSVYPRMDFDIVVGDRGDSYDRGRCRLFECYESCRIIEQAVSQMSGGAVHADRMPRLLAPKPGDAYDHIESARGSLGVYLVSDGSPRPYRMHVRSPAFCNLALVPLLSRGHTLSDLVVVLGSLDPVFGEVDR
ncbi:MAG: NADH-quinone oxidoreductase subunit D [Actinobacteria bacterium]|nr:MAG: NADH-quinone oxidoreductase subunit D [Actinomycetota bacterium]